MVGTIIKGGVWKNTEDEVLKAAIAKYGKNQWARISSLLVRKTPKQHKARWYEWLDPSIKKTEWSKEEDEKLLHVAKLMPTQWRTVSPIVGRTATQCIERYQKLLDEAEVKENEELGLAGPSDTGPSTDDVRKLRPGEIDPDPETKPARPDPIDMDEDEKEMLSEARARLANTQGKKAKRKARERQLEEARRLAVLQKKRELKQAGIIMRSKTKSKGMDYNADIPFEKKPAPGFYGTSEEQARVAAAAVGLTLRRLENKRKPDMEEEERRKRQRKNESAKEPAHQTKFIAARDAQIQQLKEAESIGQRLKLVLPTAQVGESELEDIVKIGQAGEAAKALVSGGSNATGRLLSDYEGLESARMTRTPRTAPQRMPFFASDDNVLTEARNLRNMTVAQTPLLGDENAPLHVSSSGGTGFEGATPQHQVPFTPNPLATLLRQGITDGSPRIGGVSATPLRTPLLDNLSINPEDYSTTGENPREYRQRMSSEKRTLKAGFMTLPKPENNFELLVPDEEEVDSVDAVLSNEDAAEWDARLKRMKEEEECKALARYSHAVQHGLPRPANVDFTSLLAKLNLENEDETIMSESQRLINLELVELLQHDSIAHPLPGTTRPDSTVSSYALPDDEALDLASEQIHLELATLVGFFPSATSVQIEEGWVKLGKMETIPQEDSWASIRTTLAYEPSTQTWVEPSTLHEEARIAGYHALLVEKRESMIKEANKAAKSEKKLGVTLGGYQMRAQTLAKRITAAFDELQKSKIEYEAFSRLRVNETAVGPRRVDALREGVQQLEHREKMLQNRYQELISEKEEAEIKIATLEDKIMTEVEAINELLLATMEDGS